MDTWEDISALTPEEQTAWLKARMPDWDIFVDHIRLSHEELAAHRAAGWTGAPPGWLTLEEYWQKRDLPNSPELDFGHLVGEEEVG